MTIPIGGHTFHGPYSSTEPLFTTAGVYVILCPVGGGHQIIDVGESSDVRERINDHDRSQCWSRKCPVGSVQVAVHYTPFDNPQSRRQIEQAIRNQYDVPCGEI